MFRYTAAADARRQEHIPQHYQMAPHDVVPRADIQLQTKPDKSTMEAVYQDVYQSRMVDVPVVQRKNREEPPLVAHHQLPTHQPTHPSANSSHPSHQPANPSSHPSHQPANPSSHPSHQPANPSSHPSHQPANPSAHPSHQPANPSAHPSHQPANPSAHPSHQPANSRSRSHAHTRRRAFEAELHRLKRDEAAAFELLDVPRDYDLKLLAKQYRKAALKYHPDRLRKHADNLSASQREAYVGMFEQVTKAYLLLMERHTQQDENRPFYELRERSREAVREQSPGGGADGAAAATSSAAIRLGKGDNFNRDLFNQIYDEHRLHAPTDEGYGDWMKANDTPEFDPDDPPKLFTTKFNTDIFNTTFQQLKRDDPHAERQLAVRDEMGVVVHGNSTAYSTLGEDDIGDFGGTANSLQYSDLKSAHTTHATLIDASRVAKHGPTFRSVKELEAHRSQLSTEPSTEEVERAARNQARAEAEEAARRERVRARDALGAEVGGRLGGMIGC